jgi:hypothetical protein
MDDEWFAAVDVPAQQRSRHELPSRLRLLCVGPVEPSWVSLTLQLDAEQCLEPQFRWVSTGTETLSLLRSEGFNCILVSAVRSIGGHGPDTVELVRAIRDSGCDAPLIVMASTIVDKVWAALCGLECEVLLTQQVWDSPALVPLIKRTIRRTELLRENYRLEIAHQRRVLRERGEADDLLNQQRQIIDELRAIARVGRTTDELESHRGRLPAAIRDYYHELLRTYVIMGSGNLGSEIVKLGELLADARISPREALELHVERVENLIRGLGNRSTRHVMARADLLVLELVIHLGDSYQRRWLAVERSGAQPC